MIGLPSYDLNILQTSSCDFSSVVKWFNFGIVVLFEMFRNESAVATIKSNFEDSAEQGENDAV